MKSEKVTLYTDGASRGNPGLGGWAAIVQSETEVVELAGKKDGATNNQMELEAVIQGLAFIEKKYGSVHVELHGDSRYVLSGIESWIDGWVRNGWMTTGKKPVENKPQWQKLMKLRDYFGRLLKLVKVEGHSGHLYNDRCDELAVQAALSIQSGKKPKLFSGSIETYKQALADTPPKSPIKKESNKGAAYSYVSLVGGKVYVDKDWASCEKRVKGKNAKFKKVFSKAEETDLVQDYTLQTLL